ncbi:MAG: isoprenyl transferase [Thermodesulfovibrionales bacterium]|nr:isoprenyl transferase [Thermodesulfovibrionales bacterium]
MAATGRIPNHIGIIMDGNGRWAAMRGLPRIEGHRRGVERTKEIVENSVELGLQTLTLYAFSLENWHRPSAEISMLMKLLELYLNKEIENLMRQDIVFKVIGETWRLPGPIQDMIREAESRTTHNKGLTLVMALSYSGRNEIVRAVKKIISSGIKAEKLDEQAFEAELDTAGLPSPDLIIRTSGEMRISNFLLWQGAYAEFYFTETLWPDFSKEEFLLAIQDFQRRDRRFGTVRVKTDAP